MTYFSIFIYEEHVVSDSARTLPPLLLLLYMNGHRLTLVLIILGRERERERERSLLLLIINVLSLQMAVVYQRTCLV